jgi:DNA-binding MarR family transcriptional regulator
MSVSQPKLTQPRISQSKSRNIARAPDSKLKLRLWLRLLRTTHKIEGTLRDRLRVEFDVTLPQFDVMAALARLETPADAGQMTAGQMTAGQMTAGQISAGQITAGMTMSELSRFLMVSNGNVTGIIDRLVNDGLVSRTAKPGDRRTSYVRLTAAGVARFASLAAAHEGWVAELLSDLNPRDAEQLMALLGAVGAGKIRTGERL